MTEHVLAYDKSIAPQEKYWDCGPASTQIVLSGLGITVSEDQLIREIGTTVDGTAYVGLVSRVLNQRTTGKYVDRYSESDPMPDATRGQLWSDIVRSIDAGFGLVVNWVAPPSNYPRGVKGSQSPAYGGGTVFHYVAVMGYDDANPRSVWVADPGFKPFGYWLSFAQLATLIPPKGWTAATAEPQFLGSLTDAQRHDVWSGFAQFAGPS